MHNDGTNATIIKRQQVNNTHWIISVQPDQLPCQEFEPGQYTELGIPDPRLKDANSTATKKFVRRLYSITSSNAIRDYLEFYVVAVPQGAVSPELVQLPEDGRLYLSSKIKGKFTLQHISPNKELIMIATGTGISPFISIFRSYKDMNRWQKLTIIHGVRFAEDLGYREELETYAKEYSNFFYIPTVTREISEQGWAGSKGRVIDIFEDEQYQTITGSKLDPTVSQVFLCGNPTMIETMEPYFKEHGFISHSTARPGNIHFERYW